MNYLPPRKIFILAGEVESLDAKTGAGIKALLESREEEVRYKTMIIILAESFTGSAPGMELEERFQRAEKWAAAHNIRPNSTYKNKFEKEAQ